MIDPSDYMDKEGQYYAESFEAETCPECKTNSEYICDSCAQCKGCCETSYGCYEIALCNDCDGSFIGKDIEGCCGSCDNCCECDTESFEARDDSWCVNHGWIRGTKIGDIIPCSNCNDMICDGCRCGGCGNCETSDCCECDRTYDAESYSEKKSISPYLLGIGIVGILGYKFLNKK